MLVEGILIYGGIAIICVCGTLIFMGFGTVGITACSIASYIQSLLGCVTAGSLFSVITSIAMKGLLVKGVVVGAITTMLGGLKKYFS